VRAVIIDKDNAPSWRPASLAGVTDAEVARHFAPLARELVLPQDGLSGSETHRTT
jgi:enoyl-CoA hydratase